MVHRDESAFGKKVDLLGITDGNHANARNVHLVVQETDLGVVALFYPRYELNDIVISLAFPVEQVFKQTIGKGDGLLVFIESNESLNGHFIEEFLPLVHGHAQGVDEILERCVIIPPSIGCIAQVNQRMGPLQACDFFHSGDAEELLALEYRRLHRT